MKPIKSHTFRGKRWRILWKPIKTQDSLPVYGQCEEPTKKGKTMQIDPSFDGMCLLDTIIHESLHACGWFLDEEVVEQSATDIARLLWRLGYRRMEEVE